MGRENYKVNIGPRLRKILDMQKEIIKDLTYDVCDSSDWEAGEIIADKIIKNNIL